jgi:hypothetical protein
MSVGWNAMARRLQVATRSNAGYPMGVLTDPENPVAGTTSSARVLSGLRELTPPQSTVEKAFGKGDNKVYGQMVLGVSDYGTGTFQLSHEDEVFDTLIRRAALDTTLATDMVITPENASRVDPPPMFMIATQRTQLLDGSFWYRNRIYNNVQITNSQKSPINQTGGDTPSPLQYEFTPSLSLRTITGKLYSATTLVVEENSDTCLTIRSLYPLALTTFIKDAVATTFTLPYKPIYSGATGAAQNIITNNGVTLPVTSVNVSSGLVTLAAAGTSGHIVVVLYQTNFIPTS